MAKIHIILGLSQAKKGLAKKIFPKIRNADGINDMLEISMYSFLG